MRRWVGSTLAVILFLTLGVRHTATGAQVATSVNSASAIGAATLSTGPVLPPRGDYRVYSGEGPDGPPKVSLEDRFQNQVVNLDPVGFFLTPVRMNGAPIVDGLSSRACYEIWTGAFGASVEVDNRFGRQTLRLGDPAALCTPTEVSPSAVVVRRDHYKCYQASGLPNAADVVVDLSDEFQNEAAVQVVAPFWFCAPAAVDGEEIIDPDEYLTCYTTASSPSASAPGPIATRNQFHDGDVNVFLFGPHGLCVSSRLETCATDDDCDDGNPCTEDRCRPTAEVCFQTPKPGPCVPVDACNQAGQCVDGECEGVITGVKELVCTLEDLKSVPCVEDELPRKLRNFVAKKVKRAGRLLEKAERTANKGKKSKADKLWRRAARQLEAIPKRMRKQRWKTCKETVEVLVEDRLHWIDEAAF